MFIDRTLNCECGAVYELAVAVKQLSTTTKTCGTQPTDAQQLKAEIRVFLSNSSAMSTVEFYSYISNNAERWRELSAV